MDEEQVEPRDHEQADDQSSPWESLAAELGATPDEGALERKVAETTPVESRAGEVPPPPPPRPSDWGSLAADLGVDVPAQPAAPTEASAEGGQKGAVADGVFSAPPTADRDDADQDAFSEPAASEPDSDSDFGSARGTSAADAAEQSADLAEDDEPTELDDEPLADEPADFAAGEDGELTDDELTDDQNTDDGSDDVAELAAAADDGKSGEKSTPTLSGEAARSAFDALFAAGSSLFMGDRRKKKAEAAAAEAAAAEAAANEARDQPTADEDVDSGHLADRPSPTNDPLADLFDVPPEGARDESDSKFRERADGADDEHPSETPDRTKRRRRRRRGRRRDASRDGQAAADQRDADLELESGGGESAEELTDEAPPRRRRSRSSEDAAESQESAPRRRTTHRSIPSWSDAIGVIVEANLAARKENPSRPNGSRRRGGRSRGGRGRGRKQS